MTTPSAGAMRAANAYMNLRAANILDGFPNPTTEELAAIIDVETNHTGIMMTAKKILDAVPFPAPAWFTPEIENELRNILSKG